jgi:hypothetical protein
LAARRCSSPLVVDRGGQRDVERGAGPGNGGVAARAFGTPSSSASASSTRPSASKAAGKAADHFGMVGIKLGNLAEDAFRPLAIARRQHFFAISISGPISASRACASPLTGNCPSNWSSTRLSWPSLRYWVRSATGWPPKMA